MKIKSILFLLILSALLLHSPKALIAETFNFSVDQKSEYILPYPGLLPDSPLFFLKNIRDEIISFTIRDNEKKARYLLNLSDKHMSNALFLSDKNKEELVLQEINKSSDEFSQIITTLKDLKSGGGSISTDFVNDLYKSNSKHKEETLKILGYLRNPPNINDIKSIIDKNNNLKIEIDNL